MPNQMPSFERRIPTWKIDDTLAQRAAEGRALPARVELTIGDYRSRACLVEGSVKMD